MQDSVRGAGVIPRPLEWRTRDSKSFGDGGHGCFLELWNLRDLGVIKWTCQEPVVCVDLELRREVLQSIRLGKHGQLEDPELLSCFRGAESMRVGRSWGLWVCRGQTH